MPRTITATEQLLRSDCPAEARHGALDLLLALAAVECHASTGGHALVLPGLLRDLVIVTTRLVGRAWLEANAEETARFTRLHTSLHAPPLPELDQLLACLLSDRFYLSRPSQRPGSELTHRRSTSAGADRRDRPADQRWPRQPAEPREPRPRPLDDLGWDESGRGTAEQPGAHLCDTAGSATSPATAAAVPTWIFLLRRVNLGMRRELRSGARRRAAS